VVRKVLHEAEQIGNATLDVAGKFGAGGTKGALRYGVDKVQEKIHAVVSEAEGDNAALETAHKAERLGEMAVRKGKKMVREYRDRVENKAASAADLKAQRLKKLAKKSELPGGARSLQEVLKTPSARLGSTVDFNPKQSGALFQGLNKGLHRGLDRGTNVAKRGLRFGGEKVSMQFHGKIDQYGGDNTAVKAAHGVEKFAERPAKYVLKTGVNELTQEVKEAAHLAAQPVKQAANKLRSMARHRFLVYKRAFLARHQRVAQARGAVMKARAIAKELALKTKPVLAALFVCFLVYAVCSMIVGPIAAALSQATTEYVTATTYPVANQDITDSTVQWKELEMLLEQRIVDIESEFPEYDEYRYDIDPMVHDPFELMSYLAAMHLEFTHPEVQAEIAAIFGEVNPLQLMEETEIRYDDNGNPYEWRILNIILKPKPFEEVVSPRLAANDAQDIYEVFMESGGNQQAFGNPFSFNWMSNISSYYGWRKNPTGEGYEFHTGLDIAAPAGTPIRSVQNGTVVVAGWHNAYGNYIVIRNESGITTLYAHCLSLGASVGDVIQMGQMIATVGSTGNSTGNHLHIEIQIDGERVNPIFYILAQDE